jgi:1-acyl-sn-glycerol-3-phosphate acyltransferase
LLRVFRIETQFTGDIPPRGLLVCNHLSYLDILVLSGLTPCIFVAKREVKDWPVLGWFAKKAGTVFVHRELRAQAAQTVNKIETALQTGALLVLFPEGTSSGGESILPFKSSLLEPAARQTHSLTAGFLRYELGDGDVSEEVCYWKDMTLVPHLINLCSKRAVQASVEFNRFREGNADRKQLARQLHAEVLRMKHAVVLSNPTTTCLTCWSKSALLTKSRLSFTSPRSATTK